jgi:hypothetical protein
MSLTIEQEGVLAGASFSRRVQVEGSAANHARHHPVQPRQRPRRLELRSGRDGSPYALLGAIAGVTYLTALLALRWRS